MSPDGEASCSHNAVVIPPAHGALAPVNTLPIVSWASFTPPGPRDTPSLWSAELDRLHTRVCSCTVCPLYRSREVLCCNDVMMNNMPVPLWNGERFKKQFRESHW